MIFFFFFCQRHENTKFVKEGGSYEGIGHCSGFPLILASDAVTSTERTSASLVWVHLSCISAQACAEHILLPVWGFSDTFRSKILENLRKHLEVSICRYRKPCWDKP